MLTFSARNCKRVTGAFEGFTRPPAVIRLYCVFFNCFERLDDGFGDIVNVYVTLW